MRRKVIDTLKVAIDDLKNLSAQELANKYGMAISTAYKMKASKLHAKESETPLFIDRPKASLNCDNAIVLYLIQSAADSLALAKKMMEDKHES